MFKYLLIFLLLCTPCYAGIQFDGTDDIINLSANASIFEAGTACSISMWILPDNDSDDTYVKIICKNEGYRLEYREDTFFIKFGWWGSTDLEHVTDVGMFTEDVLQHFVFTWDGGLDATNIHMYVNNVECTYASEKDGVSLNSRAGTAITFFDDAGGGNNFSGFANEIYVYSKVLSEDERTILYTSKVKGIGQQFSNCLVYFPMDEVADGTSANGATFVDRSGNGNDGTGDDGANDTGMTAYGESVLSYP